MAKSRRANLLGLAATATLLLLVATLIYWSFVRPSIVAPENRKALTRFASEVKIGDSKTTVHSTYDALLRTSSIDLREYKSDCWAFDTPMEFGARNWILIVSFDGDNVDGIGVRTADSVKVKPHEAPTDRVREDSRQRWKSRFGPDWET